MTQPNFPVLALCLAAALHVSSCAPSRDVADASSAGLQSLEEGFRSPPQSARPRTWWHWLGGNITKDGIEKDLAWMQRIGMGGVQNFDANLGTPLIVDAPVQFMSAEWKDAFAFAVDQAHSRGLDYAIAASPGWSETGGPWVTPQDAMKKIVWSETRVRGGQAFHGPLETPSDETGLFQDVAFHDPMAGGPPVHDARQARFYADIRVLAAPVVGDVVATPRAMSADGEAIDARALVDGRFQTVVDIPKAPQGLPTTLDYDFDHPVTIRSSTLFVPRARPPFGEPAFLPRLEVKTPAGWRKIADLPLNEAPTTVSFDPVTAAAFRLVFADNPIEPQKIGSSAEGAVSFDIFRAEDTPSISLAEWSLSQDARVNFFELKAGFTISADMNRLPRGGDVDVALPATSDILDLTDLVSDDGVLDWQAPEGRDWRVLRMGYSLTGKTNHPATPEATGLEVDKYDGEAVRRYIDTYLDMYQDAAGDRGLGPDGVTGLLTDSIEVGPSNWTPAMIDRFTQLRGYDPTPWMPVLAGVVIESRQASDSFLADYRQTLADLLASEHYATIAAAAHDRGMIVYGEALENGRPVIGDDLSMRFAADVPMAALWTYGRIDAANTTLYGDMKGAASVAHVLGQNLVAAESMTAMNAPWAFAPSDLKRIVDDEFVHGVNRIVVHTSVHQPVDAIQPGLALAIFGQYFNRHETWADMAGPWIDYISRSSYLLQQGRNKADIAVFPGEETPITVAYLNGEPSGLPIGNAFDFINGDIIRDHLKVQDGAVVSSGGAEFSAIYLGPGEVSMDLETLEGLARLVRDGAQVIGLAPQQADGLAGAPGRFDELVDELWGASGEYSVGKGRIVPVADMDAALEVLGIGPDFAYGGDDAAEIGFLHRQVGDRDIYFLTNRKNASADIQARFRVSARFASVWRAMDGSMTPVMSVETGTGVDVDLHFEPEEAYFVVFGDEDDAPTPAGATTLVSGLDGPWTVGFQSGRGAPERVFMETLAPLQVSDDPAVRYFSGVSTYSTTLDLADVPTGKLSLDLGDIGDVAEVWVNGEKAGTTWFPPYAVEVGDLLKVGENSVEIRVANVWVNRLIGDAQPGAEKVAVALAPTYRPDAPLRKAGLIGPVRLVTTR